MASKIDAGGKKIKDIAEKSKKMNEIVVNRLTKHDF